MSDFEPLIMFLMLLIAVLEILRVSRCPLRQNIRRLELKETYAFYGVIGVKRTPDWDFEWSRWLIWDSYPG